MIVRPRPHWFVILFVWRGSIIHKILPQLAFTVALATLVVIWRGELLHWKITLTTVPFSLLGVTVAIFLSVRNSASYERYTEARRLWGQLMIEVRALMRQGVSYGLADPLALARASVAPVEALRQELRGVRDEAALARLVSAAGWSRTRARPSWSRALLAELSQLVHAQAREADLHPVLLVELDRSLTALDAAMTACHRIASSPLPFTYTVILHRTVYLYCLLLPFGLLDSIGAMTPVMVAFVAYTFFAIEAMSDEIEHPFGTDANDLPLDALVRDIEIAALDLAGERTLPSPLQPVDHILS